MSPVNIKVPESKEVPEQTNKQNQTNKTLNDGNISKKYKSQLKELSVAKLEQF